MAARAAHAQGMPRIQDAGLVSRQERPQLHGDPPGVEAGLVPVHEAWEEQEPATVMGAADEGPLPGQAVAAFHRDRPTASGSERCSKDDLRMTIQDLRRPLI